MKPADLKARLQTELEKTIPPAEINLQASIRQRLVARKRSLYQQGVKMSSRSNRFRLTVALGTLVVLAALAFITPQGRATAQKLFKFFTPAESESFSLPPEQLNLFKNTPTPAPTFDLSLATVSASDSEPIEATAVPLPTSSTAADILRNCETTSNWYSYACQIALAESKVSFDAQEFPSIPRGYVFVDAKSNPAMQLISINYSVAEGGGYLTLIQGTGVMPPTSSWSEVPAKAIERVQVGNYYGEFARGQFAFLPGATNATWQADMSVWRVRWAEGDRWFSLEKMGDTAPAEYLDKEALLSLAASLVDAPSTDANTTVDKNYQMSFAEAEAAAGFDLLEPTILPNGFELAYARHDVANQMVILLYKPKDQPVGVGGLYIIEMPRNPSNELPPCADCPTGVVEQVEVNGITAYYWQGSFFAGTDVQPLATPVWQGNAPQYTLTWSTSELVITLNYTLTDWYQGQLSKTDLIKIAESMR